MATFKQRTEGKPKMIRLGDKYAIKADEYCYSLHEIKVAENDTKTLKAGEEYTVSMGSYWPTVSGCIKALIKKLRRRAIATGGDMSMQEAAVLFREIESTVFKWAGEAGMADV